MSFGMSLSGRATSACCGRRTALECCHVRTLQSSWLLSEAKGERWHSLPGGVKLDPFSHARQGTGGANGPTSG